MNKVCIAGQTKISQEEKRLSESGETLEYKSSGICFRHEYMEPKKSTLVLHTAEFVPLNSPEARSDTCPVGMSHR